MKLQLFKAFIAGSSFPAVILFYHGFNSLQSKYKMENMNKLLRNIDPYYIYTLLAPLYFGIMSIIAILLSMILKLHFRYGYFLISLISPLFVSIFIKYYDVYIFDNTRWIKQYLYLYIYHMINYNLIIANIYYLLLLFN